MVSPPESGLTIDGRWVVPLLVPLAVCFMIAANGEPRGILAFTAYAVLLCLLVLAMCVRQGVREWRAAVARAGGAFSYLVPEPERDDDDDDDGDDEAGSGGSGFAPAHDAGGTVRAVEVAPDGPSGSSGWGWAPAAGGDDAGDAAGSDD